MIDDTKIHNHLTLNLINFVLMGHAFVSWLVDTMSPLIMGYNDIP